MFRKAIVGDFVAGELVSYRISSTYYKNEELAFNNYGKRFIKLVERPECNLTEEEIINAEQIYTGNRK